MGDTIEPESVQEWIECGLYVKDKNDMLNDVLIVDNSESIITI